MQAAYVRRYLDAAEQDRKANMKLVNRLKKRTPRDLDQTVLALHDEAFEQIDCLKCANCCKTTSPIFRNKDIDRLAQHLRVKPVDFIDEYLYLDDEGDYVLNTAPCPFLDNDNYCDVYEARPLACREYPHTNRRRFYQLLGKSYRNTMICPAVSQIFEKLRETYN